MAVNSEVVALVKVKSYNNFFQFTGGLASNEHQQPLSATFEIVELLRGDEQRTEIEVFGDPGNLCRPYIDYLKAGEYYVVALNKSDGIDHGDGIIETPNDYVLWNCGEFWINHNPTNEQLTGRIYRNEKKDKEYSYAEFRQYFFGEDFEVFLTKFNQDKSFQLSRVRFPHEQTIIDGHDGGEALLYFDNSSQWDLLNLEYDPKFNDGIGLDYKQDTIAIKNTKTIKQFGRDSSTGLNWNMEFQFTLIEKKWVLTSSKDLSY